MLPLRAGAAVAALLLLGWMVWGSTQQLGRGGTTVRISAAAVVRRSSPPANTSSPVVQPRAARPGPTRQAAPGATELPVTPTLLITPPKFSGSVPRWKSGAGQRVIVTAASRNHYCALWHMLHSFFLRAPT